MSRSVRSALPPLPDEKPASRAVSAKAGRSIRWTGLLALCRVSNLPTVWMNVTTAVVLSGAAEPVSGGVLLLVSLSAFYTSGMAFNDVFDAAVDEETQPYRPIPSGQVTLGQAMTVAIGLLVVALACLLATPFPSSVGLGVVLGVAIVVYDRYHKSFSWAVLVMASCRLLLFLVCAWAMVGSLPVLVVLAGAVQFTYTLLLTVVARRENQRGRPYAWPLVPWLIAGMCLVDGVFLAFADSALWLLPAIALAALTRLAQRWLVRGD